MWAFVLACLLGADFRTASEARGHSASPTFIAVLPQDDNSRAKPFLGKVELSAGPRDDPCDGATWENGAYDGVNGYLSDYPLNYGPSITVDDVDLPAGNIETAVWYSVDTYTDGTGEGDIVVVPERDSRPVGEPEAAATAPMSREATGERLFDLDVFVNVLSLDLSVAAGLQFVGMRPRFNDYAHSYILTAPLTGSDSYLWSLYPTCHDWCKWSDLAGVESNVAFCLFVRLAGDPTGACCLSGDCTRGAEEECRSIGGEYQGDNTSCYRTICPGSPGACCLPDRSCELLKQSDCEGRAGRFAGSGVKCTPNFCPACLHSLYEGGLEAFDAILCQREIDGEIEAWAVDDVSFERPVRIDQLHWYTFEQWPISSEVADVLILTDADGEPGTKLLTATIPVTRELFQQNFQSYVFLNSFREIEINLNPGTYWIGLRLVVGDGPRAYWLVGSPIGHDLRFRSRVLGYRDWTPLEEIVGTEGSSAFCINGRESEALFGACCLGGPCALRTEIECTELGGEYRGDGAECVPNPCPNAPGACCVGEEPCTFLSPDDCAARGGDFRGADVECVPGVCPLPNICDESFWNNGAFDGADAYLSVRGSVDEWTVDDFRTDVNTNLTHLQWYAVDSDFFSFSGSCDIRILAADGENGAPGTRFWRVNGVPARRFETGVELFDRRVYQYQCERVISLPAGNYYLGLRPVAREGESAWLTAPLSGSGAYREVCDPDCRWLLWSDGGGESRNVAFCLVEASCHALRGDSDCNGSIDFDDIDCFVLALISEDRWRTCGRATGCDYVCMNDINEDGRVDFADIDPFVECLIAGGCP